MFNLFFLAFIVDTRQCTWPIVCIGYWSLLDWQGHRNEKRARRQTLLNGTIGGPIQCVVSYRDQCAHKHTSYIIMKCVYVRTDLYMKLHTELGCL